MPINEMIVPNCESEYYFATRIMHEGLTVNYQSLLVKQIYEYM